MTGRDYLDRRLGWVHAAMYFGIALVAVPALIGQAFGIPLVFGPWMWPGCAVVILTVTLGHNAVLRCPWCRGHLGDLLLGTGFWRTDPKLRYCPYCRRDLERNVRATETG